jgi:hypothetical protein
LTLHERRSATALDRGSPDTVLDRFEKRRRGNRPSAERARSTIATLRGE